MGYVYRHIRHDTNEPFYIGISLKTDNKYKRAFSKQGRSDLWKRITNKTSYSVQIILDNLTEEETKEKEKEFIKIYGRIDLGTGTLCNFTSGGDGTLNFCPTDEFRKNASERMLGENNPMFGKYGEENPMYGVSRTKETKDKISAKAKGRVKSEETKQKISLALKGRVMSEETRAKMSAAQKGENHPNFGKTASEETRIKMSLSRTGRKHTEEAKARMSEAQKLKDKPNYGEFGELHPMFGKHHSDETKNLISLKNKGKRMGAENPRSKLVLNKETGIIYYSALEAHRELSLKVSIRHFNAMLLGKYPNKTSCTYA